MISYKIKFRYFLLFIPFVVALSCTKNDLPPGIDPVTTIVSGNGIFIINEGNFRAGNGSLSYYSYDSSKIKNDVFRRLTGRALGDVPNSMQIYSDKAYIVVNNSGRIEVVEKNTFEQISTIDGLVSPRNILIINNNKAYVTSMYSDSVTVLNLKNNTISGFIDIKKSSESGIVVGNKAFIASWIGGDMVMVIDTNFDTVVDSIVVGTEPESMELDRNNNLWVLCNGGWNRVNVAEIDRINTSTNEVENKFLFPSLSDSPSCLRIDGNGDTLYYLEKGVRRISINADALPGDVLINEEDRLFYKMGINPANGEIIVTDAVDYQQDGYVLRYTSKGQFISSSQAGIIPGFACFKVPPDPVIE